MKEDINDILFESRNKEYGAYALRSQYAKRMTKAMWLGFSVTLFLFLCHYIYGQYLQYLEVKELEIEIKEVILTEPPLALPVIKKLEASKALTEIVQKAETKIEDNATQVVKDESIKEPIKEELIAKKDTVKADPSPTKSELPKNGGDVISTKSGSATGEISNQPGFERPKQSNAQFPGCEGYPSEKERASCTQKNFQKYINQKYQEHESKFKNVKANLKISFRVNKEGIISNIEIANSTNNELSEVVKKILEAMNEFPTKWSPARINGNAIMAKYSTSLKIDFGGLKLE